MCRLIALDVVLDRRFLSVTIFVPSEVAGSNSGRRWRCERVWLARKCSGLPSATDRGDIAFGDGYAGCEMSSGRWRDGGMLDRVRLGKY